MASSRRKSCVACARGKRRCDLGFPQCDRCLARRVTCAYLWISPEEAQEMAKSINPGLGIPQEFPHDNFEQHELSETRHWNHHLAGPRESHRNDTAISGPLSSTTLTLAPALVPLLDEIIGRGRTLSFLAPDPQLQSSHESCLNAATALRSRQPLHDIGISTAPLRIPSSSSITAGALLRVRAEYAARRLASQVTTLAETGQAAFIHHSQVDTSPILREVLASCSLYSMRNSKNSSLIGSEIARRAKLLVEATEIAISLTSPSSADLLTAVQALLIYQCMRRFSTGDVEQQAQAELDASHLGRWLGILQEQTQGSSYNSCDGTRLDFSIWKDWVRAESLRRTLVFAGLIDSTHTILSFGWYDGGERITKLSFTAQAALWEARSAEEWYQARWQRLWFEVNMSRFQADTEAASPDDLDELGIIIRVSYVGIKEAKEWLGNDRALLVKWGLSS